MNVILLGPPGSGKGTQGAILARRLGVPKIATGELLSDAVQRSTELGRQAKQYMDRGSLVPDEIILRLVGEQLASPDAERGIVLDGFPRTIRQAEAVNRMLAARGEGARAVVLFDVPEEDLVRRLLARAAAEERSDETPEAIRRRLDVYRRSTAPLVGYYRELGVLTIIPGTDTVEEVAEAVKRAVGE
jgi:adenylate kinase